MRLIFDEFDGRRINFIPVTDQDTGHIVGWINSSSNFDGGGISINLFDHKYKAEVRTKPECRAFVKAVETVLNHMICS